MADIIQHALHKVLGDGARASKFKCYIQLPVPYTNQEAEDLDTIVKSTTFPTRENEVINIKHKGRTIPLPGQEKYTHELEITFYLQEDHANRKIFDYWAEALNYDRYSENSSPTVKKLVLDQSALRTSITLTQMDFHNKEDRISYRFYNTFPTRITGSAAGSDSIDTIGEFSVAFAFSHYEIIRNTQVSYTKDLEYLPFDVDDRIQLPHSKKPPAHVQSFFPYQETAENWIG